MPLRDDDLACLKNLTKLQYLMVLGRDAQLTDAWLESISGLTGLEFLQLYNIPFTTAGLPHMRALKNVSVLNLHDARITSLEPLRPLDKLGSLGLYGNPIEDEALVTLQAFPRLYDLDLRNTKVTDRGMAYLRAFPGSRT